MIALFDASDSKIHDVRNMIHGKEVQFHTNYCDKNEIMQHYEILPKELAVNDLLGSIITRMSVSETTVKKK